MWVVGVVMIHTGTGGNIMADNYVLITDSACDILPDKLAEWKVEMIPLGYLFTDTGKEQLDHGEPIRDFYRYVEE